MVKFGEIERIVFDQVNAVLPLPPVAAPLTSPFPTTLTSGGTINLAEINIKSGHGCEGVLLQAVVNWSATFTPPSPAATLNVPGFADVTFELLRNGRVIYRISQSAPQKGFPLVQPTFSFTVAIPTYEIAALLFFDALPVLCHMEFEVYTLRATNISLVAPQVDSGAATTTAQVGAVTLVASIVEARRDAAECN